MIDIFNYKRNKSLPADKNSKIFDDIITSSINNKPYNNFFKKLSKIYNIPPNIFNDDAKIFFHKNFVNSKGILGIDNSYLSFIRDFIKNLFFILWVFFFHKNKYNISKCDLIVDEIHNQSNYELFKKLANKFNTIIVSFVKINSIEKNYIFKRYKNIYIKSYIAFFKLSFFSLFFSFLYSIKFKKNLISMNIFFFRNFIKYNQIFLENRAKYIIQERHHNTSHLKKYIFKKYGGKFLCVYQRNIPVYCSTGMYACGDIFFTIGNNSQEIAKKCKYNFKKYIPVGSLHYENWLQRKNFKGNQYDILNVASDFDDFMNVCEKSEDSYYEHFRWLAKISREMPNLKIGVRFRYKLGENHRFIDIFKNTNVELIDASKDKSISLYSYGDILKSKVICTWNSTLFLEIIGKNKICLCLNPHDANPYFPDNNLYNNFLIKKYANFKKEILKNLSIDSLELSNQKDYCYNFDNVSDLIYQNLIKYQN